MNGFDLNSLHFLRPEWFWGFAAFLLIPFLAVKGRAAGGLWQRVCDSFLLQRQLVSGASGRTFYPAVLLSLCWTLALIALAGPAWEKLPQPAFSRGQDTVFVMDISVFMTPSDTKPSRMERAVFKMHDFLQKLSTGQNALVLYDNEPFTAVPLTSDKKVIENILPTVRAGMMGGQVPRLDLALDQALQLLKQAGAVRGNVVVLGAYTDTKDTPAAVKAAGEIKKAGYSLFILGIGTEQGAPIQRPDGSFLSYQGKPMLSAVSVRNFEKVAQAGGGVYMPIRLDGRDVEAVLAKYASGEMPIAEKADDKVKADVWKDFGAVMAWTVLPFAALGFRRGWLGVILMFVLLSPSRAYAWSFSELWERPDRQEARRIAEGEKPVNPAVFEKDAAWRGAAEYKAGNYEEALKAFSEPTDAEMLYNLANTQAHAGQVQQAVETYKKVLELNPDHGDAAFNKKYLEDQLKQNRQNQQDQNQNQQDQNQNRQDQQNQQNQQDQQSGDKDRQDGNNRDQQQEQSGHNESQSPDEQEQQQNRDARSQAEQQQSRAEQQAGQREEQQQSRAEQQAEQQQKAGTKTAEQQVGEQERPQDHMPGSAAGQKAEEDREKQEQLQWLSVIQDDPSGLLRERIKRRNLQKRGIR